MGLRQNKKLLLFERHCPKNEKTSHRLEEVFANHNLIKGVCIQSIQRALKTQQWKNKQYNKILKYLNKPFTKEDKHMKRRPTSLVTGEMQSKITIRCYHTPNRIAKIKNTDYTKCWQGYRATQLFYSNDGNVKWYNHFRKQVVS